VTGRERLAENASAAIGIGRLDARMPCSPTAARSRSDAPTAARRAGHGPSRAARRRTTAAAARARARRPKRLIVSWKGRGAAVLVEGQGLAVEDQRSAGEAAHDLDELRHPVGDVGQGPAEHLDPRARAAEPVHLDPCAVELDLDRRRAGQRHGVGHRCGGRSKHRLHRSANGQPDLAQVGATASQVCRVPERAAEHHRAPHLLQRAVSGPRQGIGDQAGERTHPHLAEQHPGEQPLLGRGGP
jgi:hypothetical protein